MAKTAAKKKSDISAQKVRNIIKELGIPYAKSSGYSEYTKYSNPGLRVESPFLGELFWIVPQDLSPKRAETLIKKIVKELQKRGITVYKTRDKEDKNNIFIFADQSYKPERRYLKVK